MAELSDSPGHGNSEGAVADEPGGSTLVRFGVPVEEFALYETLVSLPYAEFECGRTVQTANRAVMPLVWARRVDREELEVALGEDSSVRRASLVEDRAQEILYRMEWESRLRVLVRMLSTADSLVLDAYGTSDGWTLQVLYSSRSHLSEVGALIESLDVGITIDSIRRLEGVHGDQYGLTANQLEALAVAHEMGYYEIPRATDLDAVAAELGLTHQSLSERLRRAHDALLRNTIRERSRGRY